MVQNKGVIFKQIPAGLPVPGKDLVVETREFDIEQAPQPGGITTKNLWASLDPYMRTRLRDPSIPSYSPAYVIGEPIAGALISKVLKSDSPNFKSGDLVNGFIPHEEYSSLSKEQTAALKRIDNPYHLDIWAYLGPLGSSGLTAYSSLYSIGKPVKGETIFVSAASGAVGQFVGQIAKHEGLRVIGSVGSDDKLDFILNELKFDGGFNYKKEKPADALKRLAPKGVDIYYDNVGGEQLEAALDVMNNFGRIVACGMISDYNKAPEDKYPIKNLMHVVTKRLEFKGFIVSDANMGPVYLKERDEKLGQWLSDGSFKAKYTITEGIENGPEALVGMLQGKNFGKAVLKIADV